MNAATVVPINKEENGVREVRKQTTTQYELRLRRRGRLTCSRCIQITADNYVWRVLYIHSLAYINTNTQAQASAFLRRRIIVFLMISGVSVPAFDEGDFPFRFFMNCGSLESEVK